jgi:hypothetical protein
MAMNTKIDLWAMDEVRFAQYGSCCPWKAAGDATPCCSIIHCKAWAIGLSPLRMMAPWSIAANPGEFQCPDLLGIPSSCTRVAMS